MTSLKPYITVLGLTCLLIINRVNGKTPVHKMDDEVSTTLIAGSKDAIFSSRASYTFNLRNATDVQQTGTVSYIATTPAGITVAQETRQVKLSKHSSAGYDFTIPAQNPGFQNTL